MKKFVELHRGSISVETDPDVIESQKSIDNVGSLANEIWNKIRPLLNSITNTMKKILENVCGVQEIHTVMDKYCDGTSVEEIASEV